MSSEMEDPSTTVDAQDSITVHAQVDINKVHLLPIARALFVQAATEHMIRTYSQTKAQDMEKFFAGYCNDASLVSYAGKALSWSSIKMAMITPMWANITQVELDFFMDIAHRLDPDDAADAINLAKNKDEEDATTVGMLKQRRLQRGVSKQQTPSPPRKRLLTKGLKSLSPSSPPPSVHKQKKKKKKRNKHDYKDTYSMGIRDRATVVNNNNLKLCGGGGGGGGTRPSSRKTWMDDGDTTCGGGGGGGDKPQEGPPKGLRRTSSDAGNSRGEHQEGRTESRCTWFDAGSPDKHQGGAPKSSDVYTDAGSHDKQQEGTPKSHHTGSDAGSRIKHQEGTPKRMCSDAGSGDKQQKGTSKSSGTCYDAGSHDNQQKGTPEKNCRTCSDIVSVGGRPKVNWGPESPPGGRTLGTKNYTSTQIGIIHRDIQQRLSRDEHMRTLSRFGLQLGRTVSIEVKWLLEIRKGHCESRWYPAHVDLRTQEGWGRGSRPKWSIVYPECKDHPYVELSMVVFKSETMLIDDLDETPVKWRQL